MDRFPARAERSARVTRAFARLARPSAGVIALAGIGGGVALAASEVENARPREGVHEATGAGGGAANGAEPDAPTGAPGAEKGILSGRWIDRIPAPRRANGPRACSFTLPLCAEGESDGVAPARVLEVLASAERAWNTLTGALDLPAPSLDPVSGAYEIRVIAYSPERAADGAYGVGAFTFFAERDVRSAIDRGSAFSVVAGDAKGCPLDGAIARAIARAIAWRVAPATDEGTAGAQSAYLAALVTPCATTSLMDPGFFQAHPERAIVDTWPREGPLAEAAFTRGAALFWSWLDAAYARDPGGMVRATWALCTTRTPTGALRWNNEPDAFDVLRATSKHGLQKSGTLEDLFAQFGVARAVADVAPAADGRPVPENALFGASGRVRSEWDIPWPTEARRLTGRAVAPSGSAYVLVHAPAGQNAKAGATTNPTVNARLRIEASWETHASMRWTAVKLDAQGTAIGEVEIPTPPRATESQMTLLGLDGVATVLLVGTNVGDPAFQFDPDDEEWEPHGWLLTLAAE